MGADLAARLLRHAALPKRLAHATPRALARSLPLLCLALPGCTGAFSTLDPAGPAAAAVALLWWAMLAGAALLLALVMALLWLALRRRTLARIPERAWLVQGGLVLPALVLLPLAAAAFALGERLFAPRDPAAIAVEAHGRMWQWEFAYPEAAPGLRTLHVLHIPAGLPVEVALHSDDVIHSFWVPRLSGKLDAIPGRTNRLRLVAAEPGVYHGLCAEFCGRLHTAMGFAVVAHPPDQYADALRAAAGLPP